MKRKSTVALVNRQDKINSEYSFSVATLFCVLAIAALLSLTGCAKTDPNPFTDFNALAQTLSGANEVAQTHFTAEKDYWMSHNGQDKRQVKGLILEIKSSPDTDRSEYTYGFADQPEPVFIKWKIFQSGLSDLNLAFIQYTELLAKLADGDLVKQDDFDKMAKDLNNNLFNAMVAINPPQSGESGPDAGQLGFFSLAASQAVGAYIKSKRKEYLVTIINGNQRKVEEILTHCNAGIRLMADNVRTVYDFNSEKLKIEIIESSPNELHKLAEKIYADGLVTATTLDLLNALSNTYDSLAIAHQNLATGINSGQLSINTLKANISRVQNLYKELKEANIEAEKKRDKS